MTGEGLERVVIVPRNGYANRLQAWASADVLAHDLGVPAYVIWEPQPVATATPAALFSKDLLTARFITSEDFAQSGGVAHAEMPRYLTHDPSGVICLAGHDRGEQVFMPELVTLLADSPRAHTLLIIAGGKFHIPGRSHVRRSRHDFYRSLTWSAAVEARVLAALSHREMFYGLHVRGTDRSVTAPSHRQILRALTRLSGNPRGSSLFVAADTDDSRSLWLDAAQSRGFHAWTSQGTVFERADEYAGVDAIVDWIVLGKSRRLIYARESSFGAEAAVASGYWNESVPLHAPALTRALRSILGFVGRRSWAMT